MKRFFLFVHLLTFGWIFCAGLLIGMAVFGFYAGLMRARDFQMWLTK